MKDEFELQLQKDFPFMKQSKVESEQSIYRRWGCECSGGWYHLIHNMCQDITDRYKEAGVDVDLIPEQLKEKFATLRFYYSFEDAPCGIAALDYLGDGSSIRFEPGNENDDDEKKKLRHDIAQIVRTYEAKSKSVCEVCGDEKTATVRMDMSWKQSLCDSCYENYLNKL